MTSRIVKWAVAGVLALGTVPAIGFGRSKANMPAAKTVTPVGITSHAAVKHRARRTVKRTSHKKTTAHRKTSAKRRPVAKHKVSKASARHKPAVRHRVSHKKTSRAK